MTPKKIAVTVFFCYRAWLEVTVTFAMVTVTVDFHDFSPLQGNAKIGNVV